MFRSDRAQIHLLYHRFECDFKKVNFRSQLSALQNPTEKPTLTLDRSQICQWLIDRSSIPRKGRYVLIVRNYLMDCAWKSRS